MVGGKVGADHVSARSQATIIADSGDFRHDEATYRSLQKKITKKEYSSHLPIENNAVHSLQ